MTSRLMRAGLLLLGTLISADLSAARLALVIGNSDYQDELALINPRNDAMDTAAILRELEFETQLVLDADASQILDAREQFLARLDAVREQGERVEIALFFYAGHAVQYRGENYLIPLQARIFEPEDLAHEAIGADRIVNSMVRRQSEVNVVILDACRDNPFTHQSGFRSLYRSLDKTAVDGLARIDSLPGTIIAFSTAPGFPAADGAGRNSPFTSALKQHLPEPGINLLELFNRVSLTVREETAKLSNPQEPWTNFSAVPELCLRRCDTQPLSGELQLRDAEERLAVPGSFVIAVDTVARVKVGSRLLGMAAPGSPLVGSEDRPAIEITVEALVGGTQTQRIELGAGEVRTFSFSLANAAVPQSAPKPDPEPVPEPVAAPPTDGRERRDGAADSQIVPRTAPPMVTPQPTIEVLLAECEEHIRAHRLTTGVGGTAFACYREVLRRDPGNLAASSGLDKIAQQYARWAEDAIRLGKQDRAKAYIERLAFVDGNHRDLEELRQLLKVAGASAAEPEVRSPVSVVPRRQADAKQEEVVETTASTYRDGLTGMEFARIEGGCFLMGSGSDEEPREADERQHQVCLNDFWMATQEVTNKQYRLFRPGHRGQVYAGKALDGDEEPVVSVTWDEATRFAAWMSEQRGRRFRLPTEAEWEYAARAGSSAATPWTGGAPESCRYANVADKQSALAFQFMAILYCDDAFAGAAPVGKFPANEYGLFDMLGNVWEWTCSAYDPAYAGGETACAAPAGNAKRVYRGASWGSIPRDVRVSTRRRGNTDYYNAQLGFRLLMEP